MFPAGVGLARWPVLPLLFKVSLSSPTSVLTTSISRGFPSQPSNARWSVVQVTLYQKKNNTSCPYSAFNHEREHCWNRNNCASFPVAICILDLLQSRVTDQVHRSAAVDDRVWHWSRPKGMLKQIPSTIRRHWVRAEGISQGEVRPVFRHSARTRLSRDMEVRTFASCRGHRGVHLHH